MSTRREFFALVGAGAVASAATVRASSTPVSTDCPAERTRVGVATGDSHGGRTKRVWLDGEDVTQDCFYAYDDAEREWPECPVFGYVKVYKRNPAGNFYIWGSSADPDPATRREGCGSKIYHKVDGKLAWNKPYPGYGDVAYEEFSGDVRIVVV